MSLSWKNTIDGFVVGVTLALGGVVCRVSAEATDLERRPSTEERYTIDSVLAPARQHAIDIQRLTGYKPELGDCGEVMLGPLHGEYSGREAWEKLIAPVCTLVEEPAGTGGEKQRYADMDHCSCSFGYERRKDFPHEPVLVTGTKLANGLEGTASPNLIIDRARIEEIAPESLPDLLRYVSASAFYRGQGFRTTGAQYAELRGLGAGYTLVLLNGRRAPGSASDLTTNAFDLSYLPVNAVERIEIRTDASSLIHGMDAIGGIVNVVLKDNAQREARVRYGSARGGGSNRQFSFGDGAEAEHWKLGFFLDAEQSSELLGETRDRWRDQDFRRFGGRDYRLPFGAPFNVRSTDNQPLSGVGAPSAAAHYDAATGSFDFVAGERSSSSIRSFQAIEPESSRIALLANGSLQLGQAIASAEVLAVERENELQLMASFLPGNLLGTNHPQNTFGAPVMIDAVLAGLPKQREHYETSSRRGVLAVNGPIGTWDYDAFLIHSKDEAQGQLRNVLNPAVLNSALQPSDPSDALSLFSTVYRTDYPENLFIDAPIEQYRSDTTHVQASVQGALWDTKVHLGTEYRHETLDFNRQINGTSRDIKSLFMHLRVPVIKPEANILAIERLELLLGARADRYSDVGTVTKTQFGLTWQPVSSVRVLAAWNASFRPPSLVELYLPTTTAQTPMYDPRRNQVTPIQIVTGGNRDLHPPTARSRSLSVTYTPSSNVQIAAEYWRVKVRDHISLLAPMALLAHEEDAIDHRVLRAPPSSQDQALGRPGALLQLDISRANVGGAETAGVDFATEAKIATRIGRWTPRLQVTFTDKFAYSELPTSQIELEERAGVVSEFGTIPKFRAVASLSFERNDWRSVVFAHATSSYRDRDPVTSIPMQREISGAPVWDWNVSRQFGDFRATVGATNITDRKPPFVNAGGSVGLDLSQGDLAGRVIFGMISGRF